MPHAGHVQSKLSAYSKRLAKNDFRHQAATAAWAAREPFLISWLIPGCGRCQCKVDGRFFTLPPGPNGDSA
jgi:hypothetical protein